MAGSARVVVTIPMSIRERDAALGDLESALSNVPENGFAEIWVDHGAFPALCALVNAGQGWLMCVRDDGDAGLSSRNPSTRVAQTPRWSTSSGMVKSICTLPPGHTR